jgi:hypothetical protein
MEKLGFLGKLPAREEFNAIGQINYDLLTAYSNMFLPTVVFDKEETKMRIARAYNTIKRLV